MLVFLDYTAILDREYTLQMLASLVVCLVVHA